MILADSRAVARDLLRRPAVKNLAVFLLLRIFVK